MEVNTVHPAISIHTSFHVNSNEKTTPFLLILRLHLQVPFLYTNVGNENRELGYQYIDK